MPPEALVTGCNGFVGRHLTHSLYGDGWKVFGIDNDPAGWAEWMEYRRMDVADQAEVQRFIDDHPGLQIYHLAAVANPRIAHASPFLAIRTNVLGTACLYEACRRAKTLRLLVVGSSEEYRRDASRTAALTEESELDGSSIYAVTKMCSELAGRAFVRQYHCHVVFTRSFNHTGPGQSSSFVVSDFARQCAEIAAGKRAPEIRVGNIDVRRSFLDVMDVVRAYRLLLEMGGPGEVYNVCADKTHSLRELLTTLISFTGRDDVRIAVDPSRVRIDDPGSIEGTAEKLAKRTGWAPSIEIRETLRRVYDFWRGVGASLGRPA